MRVQPHPVLTVLLTVISSAAFAASSDSPNISGHWSGTAKGSYFEERQTTDGNSTFNTGSASGVFAGTFTQTGNTLTISGQITPNNGRSFSITLNGFAGDFSFWAEGSDVNVDNNTEQLFFAGHYTTKGDKIVGTILVFRQNNITDVVVSMTKDKSAATQTTTQVPAVPSTLRAPISKLDPPFNVTGSASGKSSTFGNSAKAAKFSSSVTGTITPADQTVTLTFATGQQTFKGLEFATDKALVLYLSDSSEKFVGFAKSSSNSAQGSGWICGPTRLVDVKFSVKKQ